MGSNDLGPMDDGLQDLGLPVPVQTFLWGQIAPFIRPKLGKLHEATCMVSSSYCFLFLCLFIHECSEKSLSVSVCVVFGKK